MVASGKAEIKSSPLMDYNPPQLIDLIDRAKNHVRVDYKRNNASRLELISLLEITHDHILNFNKIEHKLMALDDRDICLGAWVYCIESIANEYRVTNPSFKDGYVFSSGSTLYEILLNQLGIDKDHQMSEKIKLYYLCKFYNHLISNKSLGDAISISQFTIIKEQIIIMMRSILAGERDDQDRILRAIPSEKSIDSSMLKLYEDYMSQVKYPNPERMLLAKLAVAICKNSSFAGHNDCKEFAQMIPRSARVKIGALIYMIESINDSYILRKPKENSVLYDLCEKALGNNYSYLDNETKLACLMALELYLNNDKNRELLEIDINNQAAKGWFEPPIYIDPILRPVSNNIGKMIKKLSPNESRIPISKVTMSAAAVGAVLGSISGYGAGHAIGYGISLTDQAGARKNNISGTTGYAMQVMFGMTNCYYGYYAADIMVTAITERLFAKIFEALGAILGAVGAGGVCFVIYDLSFNTALELCKLCLQLNKGLNFNVIKESDILFITTLLELPPEAFSEMDKDKLRKITDISVVGSGLGFLSQPSQPAPLKLVSQPEVSVLSPSHK